MNDTKELSPAEFADRAGMHLNSIYKAIREGRLPARRVTVGISAWEYRIPESALPLTDTTSNKLRQARRDKTEYP